jgi:hypothetical protein
VDLLLAHEADAGLADAKGRRPADIAAERGHSALATALAR